MFVKLLNFECLLSLSKRFFAQHRKIFLLLLQYEKSEFFQYEEQANIFSLACAMLNST